MTEYRLGKQTIKIIPQNIMPTSSDQEITVCYKIEIHRKDFLRPSKLIQSIKYNPSPALTLIGFLTTLTTARRP